MNFLAHLYLTKEFPAPVSVGNFLADAVKGKNALSGYPEDIQTGILIHRQIDHFTDTHPLARQGTQRLFGNYGKFAGIILDIFYDHILAGNWHLYSLVPLEDFARAQYTLITDHWEYLPQRTRFWFQYMHDNNLLVNYAHEDVIEDVLQRMDRRLGSISGMGGAITELRLYKQEYTAEFKTVFGELQAMITQ